MAGKKNHIIPKWMQKGFASRVDGDQVFTWFYRKGLSPRETNTREINAENYFYGKKDELNADDIMTDVETYKLSPLINVLRDGNTDCEKLKTEIGELVAHFSIRTKVIRKGFEQMSEKTLAGMKEVLTDDETVSNVLLNPSEKQLEGIFDDALNSSDPKMDEALEILKIFGFEDDEIKNLMVGLAKSALQNEKTKDEMEDVVKNFFSDMFDGAVKDLPNSIKKGHNQSLHNYVIPPQRVKRYKQLVWNVYEKDSLLILGDVACIFREIGNKLFRSSCDIDKTGQIYLPISSNKILIGTLESEEIETNVQTINEAIAKCSCEQFICSEKADDKIALMQIIGTDAYLASDEEMEKELGEIRNNVNWLKDEMDK